MKEKVDFAQFNYSMGEREAEQKILPFCKDNGIATLINRPFMREGDYSGKRRRKNYLMGFRLRY